MITYVWINPEGIDEDAIVTGDIGALARCYEHEYYSGYGRPSAVYFLHPDGQALVEATVTLDASDSTPDDRDLLHWPLRVFDPDNNVVDATTLVIDGRA